MFQNITWGNLKLNMFTLLRKLLVKKKKHTAQQLQERFFNAPTKEIEVPRTKELVKLPALEKRS